MVVVGGGGVPGVSYPNPSLNSIAKGLRHFGDPPPMQHQKGFAAQRRREAGLHGAEEQHGCAFGNTQPSLGSFAPHPPYSPDIFPSPPQPPTPPEVSLLSPAVSASFFSSPAGDLRALRWILTGHAPLPPSLHDVRMELIAAGGMLPCSCLKHEANPFLPSAHSLLDRVCNAKQCGEIIHPPPPPCARALLSVHQRSPGILMGEDAPSSIHIPKMGRRDALPHSRGHHGGVWGVLGGCMGQVAATQMFCVSGTLWNCSHTCSPGGPGGFGSGPSAPCSPRSCRADPC